MTDYAKAPEVEVIAKDLIANVDEHADLDGHLVLYVWRLGKPARSGGKVVMGRARKVSGLNAFLITGAMDPLFVVEVSREVWEFLEDYQRRALVDHELCHCKVGEDAHGEPKLVLRGHDYGDHRVRRAHHRPARRLRRDPMSDPTDGLKHVPQAAPWGGDMLWAPALWDTSSGVIDGWSWATDRATACGEPTDDDPVADHRPADGRARPVTATAPLAPPPGQAELWPPQPGRRPSSWRVVWAGGAGPAVRDLAVAAGRAAAVARLAGLAWLVGADSSWCAVTYRGDVAPSTGWAAAAARIIARSTPTS